MDVCLRVLKESNKSRLDSFSVRNSVLIISHITFRDCPVHFFFPTTFLEVAVYGHGFYELSSMLMRKNVNNDVSKDSPTGQLVVATRKAIHYMQCEHSLRKRSFSRINLNVESFETGICTINCGQVKRRFSKKGYARSSHAGPDFAHNQAERREIENHTSEHSPLIKTRYQICFFDDLPWIFKTM